MPMNARDIVEFYVANRVNRNADVFAVGQYAATLQWDSPIKGRPNRRSWSIQIELGRAFVDDFNNMTEDQQDATGAELAGRVEIGLAGYDELLDDPNPFIVPL